MKTNFFECLAALNVMGDWQIIIKTAPSNRMLVSVLFSNDKVSDEARKLVPPMLLKGTTIELDEGFFSAVTSPVKQTAELFINMEQHAAAQEEARKQSRMEKDKEQQTKKGKDTGNKKYETQMKKVTELEAAGKYREAYGQLPKVADFPDFEDEINTKKEELTEKFDQPSLFEE